MRLLNETTYPTHLFAMHFSKTQTSWLCKEGEKIITNPLQKSFSLTSDDCGGNAILHMFQTAVLDDVNVDLRLAIGRYSSS